MAGRGLVTAAALIAIALTCVAVSRKLERERRLIAKLRQRGAFGAASGVSLDELSGDEREAAETLAGAGVLSLHQNRCHIRGSELAAFWRKRLRLTVSGALGVLLLAVIVAALLLRR